MDQLTGSDAAEREDTRTAGDDTAYPDQGRDLGQDFYWTADR